MKSLLFKPSAVRAALMVGALGAVLSTSANAALLISGATGNGDFSNAANNGSFPGLLAGYNGNVGSGPWRASGDGLDLLVIDLLSPSATIGSGAATFAGIATGLNVVTLVNNSGSFYQLTTTAWQPNTTYTLTATVTSTSLLTADVFSLSGGAGIGLYSGTDANTLGSDVATTLNDGPNNDIEITLLGGGTSALVELTFVTGAVAPSGNVGARLFVGDTTNPVAANVLGNITFDSVVLDATATIPEPSSAVLGLGTLGLLTLRRRRN